MARETKAQIQARAQADNDAVALIPTGTTAEGFFGTMTLGDKVSDSDRANWADDGGPWDYYAVYFDVQIGDTVCQNMRHHWSSTAVLASFKASA